MVNCSLREADDPVGLAEMNVQVQQRRLAHALSAFDEVRGMRGLEADAIERVRVSAQRLDGALATLRDTRLRSGRGAE